MRFLKSAAFAALLMLSAVSAHAASCVTADDILTNIKTDKQSEDAVAKVMDHDLSAKIGTATNFPYTEKLDVIDAVRLPTVGNVVLFPLDKDGCAFAKDGTAADKFENVIGLIVPAQTFGAFLSQIVNSSI